MAQKLKIGFIDYYIDEWHANNYPQFIRQSPLGDQAQVTLAWEQTTMAGKKPLAQWCQEQGVQPAASMEQVIEQCDAIVVLAPSDPQVHEQLAHKALQSGKPVYVDKTFADSRAAAKRMFDLARRHNTPMFSSSALRFGSALENALAGELKNDKPPFVATRGGGTYHEYSVHQLEMMVMTLGVGAKRVMQCGVADAPMMLVDYGDGRRGVIQHGYPGFSLCARYGQGKFLAVDKMDDFFPRFITAMLRFLQTREVPVPEQETLQIMGLIEAGHAALAQPDQWTPVAQG